MACASGQVMMGICADNAVEGVAVLQQWVNALRLPRCDWEFAWTEVLLARMNESKCPRSRKRAKGVSAGRQRPPAAYPSRPKLHGSERAPADPVSSGAKWGLAPQ